MPVDTCWFPLARVADAVAVLMDVRWVECAAALLRHARRCGVLAVLDADSVPPHVLQDLAPEAALKGG